MDQQDVNITEYLRITAELESSVYRQEEAVKCANDYIKKNDPQDKYDRAIQDANWERDHLPKEDDYIKRVAPSKSNQVQNEWNVGGPGAEFILILIGVAAFAVGVSVGLGVIIFIGLALLGIGVPILVKRIKEGQKEKNTKKEMDDDYQNRLKKAKENFQRDYNTQLAKIDSEVKSATKALSIDKNRAVIAKKERDKLTNTLSETRKALSKMYECNIIHPKYRNMVAMCSFYEYYSTGRCTELTGPNGAYNIFEYELRQNMIISKLDKIIDELEAIKHNQFILYGEMVKTNEMLSGIKTEMSSIYRSVNEIKQNSYITAECAKITAQNSEAIKYIALING